MSGCALQLVEQMHDQVARSLVPAKAFMFARAGLDDWDRAAEWALQSVQDERDPMTVMNASMEPLFEPVRSDPRYPVLLETMRILV